MANKKTYTASQTLDPVPEFSNTVMNHIYFVADSMIGKANLTEDDRCDLIQDLSLAAWRAMSTYRETENTTLDTYVCRAVDFASKNMYRNRIRIRRSGDIPMLSLDELLENGKNEALLPTVDDRDYIDLLIDVRDTVNSLPAPLKKICQLIMAGYNFKEIAKIMRTSEASIRLRRIPEIREHFVKNGIDYPFKKI